MQSRRRLTPTHKISLAVSMAFVLLAGMWVSGKSTAVPAPATFKLDPQSLVSDDSPAGTTQSSNNSDGDAKGPLAVDYEIQKGDTLSEIFEDKGIPAALLQHILEADSEYLSLETLMPGKVLTFRYNDEHQLTALDLQLDPARKVSFVRQDDDSFIHQQVESKTHWESQILTGEIRGSFYASGLKAGLSEAQVASLSHLLKNKLNFRRDLRAGDTFAVMVGHEITEEDQATGQMRIEAVSLSRGKHVYNAFLYNDGNYYDENGESILPAFLRWPTARHFRVSSPFNPKRLHPVTGRRAPHNGVDLATPSGTPVRSTGDGVVTRIGNHPYAGKYIDIDHNGSFETRYLHLSKIMVKRGERVKRGEKIALSGNTGRTTGPHLHFEFHVKGRPVNPLTADIPTAASVPRKDLASFKSQVHQQLALMRAATDPASLVATGPDQGSDTATN